MQIFNQIYHYQMPSQSMGIWQLQCRLRIFQTHPDVQTVMITDMGFEMGWFIPYIVEKLVDQVVQEFQLDPAKLIWIEHYASESSKLTCDDFSRVTFEWQNGKAKNPEWTPIALEVVQSFIAQPNLQVVGSTVAQYSLV